MPSLLQKLLLGVALACLASGHAIADSVGSNYKIDVHSHVVPPIWRKELISAGFPVKNGTLYTDGFPAPDWTLDSHISNMDSLGVNYSTISVSAPGVFFLKEARKAKSLARSINLLLHNYTQTHPTRLGALCLLPLPYIDEAVGELEVFFPLVDHLVKSNLESVVFPGYPQFYWRGAVHQRQWDVFGRHFP